MNKKIFVIPAIIIQIVSAFLLYIDGTFIWYDNNLFGTYNVKESHSFDWLFNTQLAQAYIVQLVLLLIILNIVVKITGLFTNISFLKSKWIVVLPVITLAAYMAFAFYADTLSSAYTWDGEARFSGVGLGIICYIEMVLLGTNALIEFLIHFGKTNKNLDG